MHYIVRKEATESGTGKIRTEKRAYRPLDTVKVRVQGRGRRDRHCVVEVLDGRGQRYFKEKVLLKNNKGTVEFVAGGELGPHIVHLYFPDTREYVRRTMFRLDCETTVETGHAGYDAIYPITKEGLLLNRREFPFKGKPFVGYISADSGMTHGVWLRDWIYHLPAYVYWESERGLTCGLDRFFEVQNKDGSSADGIENNGKTWRSGVESDVEYILVMGVWGTWRVTGDDVALRKAMPKLERAMAYIQRDRMRWDKKRRLVIRGHTCDTWDYEFIDNRDDENWLVWKGRRRVIATCDQTGVYLAFAAMAEMYQALGSKGKATKYRKKAGEFRTRANRVLWDGGKYLHHVHVDPIEHPGFDERNQLALANVWAMTRGLADHKKCLSIIKEYQRRHKQTGDAYPWWTLQPGYPDELGYYTHIYERQGGYCNGGLVPFVGGELARAAFEHGMERYGVELLNQYWKHLKKTGNEVYCWYWPNGEAGMRSTNEVAHNGWGMSEWLMALLEGLCGIKDQSGQYRKVSLCPRWAASSIKNAYVAVRYAANNCYFAYQMRIDRSKKKIRVSYTGSGKSVRFRVLLPKQWKVRSVRQNGKAIKTRQEKIEGSSYVNFAGPMAQVGVIEIGC